MPSKIITTIATGQAVSSSDIYVKSIELVAGPANDAIANIYGAGGEIIRIASAKGTTEQIQASKGTNDFDAQHVPGPVTADLTGAGAWLKINY